MILGAGAAAEAARPAGRAWGLTLLRRAGSISPADVDGALSRALDEARTRAATLGVAAFPAALPARLARFELDGGAGPLRKRLALVAAVAAARL
jgi:hypothetical protein